MRCTACGVLITVRDAVYIPKHGPHAGLPFCQCHAAGDGVPRAAPWLGQAGALTAARYVWATRLVASVQATDHCEWCQVFALLGDVLRELDDERRARRLVQGELGELSAHLTRAQAAVVARGKALPESRLLGLTAAWRDEAVRKPGSVVGAALRKAADDLEAVLDGGTT